MLGHHQGDLFENFFIRIIRGSGLKGLISLSKKTKFNNVTILRPLINQKKEYLVFISKKVFDFYVKDPSNKNENYLRSRIRTLKKPIENSGIKYEQIYKQSVFKRK